MKHFPFNRISFLIIFSYCVSIVFSFFNIQTDIDLRLFSVLVSSIIVVYMMKLLRVVYKSRKKLSFSVPLEEFKPFYKTYLQSSWQFIKKMFISATKIANAISEQFLSYTEKYQTLLLIVLVGLLIRVGLILFLPVSNDEGYYFYDAYFIRQGLIPYVDYLTKSGPHIYLLALTTAIAGNSILAGRILTIIVFVFNVSLIYTILKHMVDKKAAWIAVMIFSLYPEIAALTSYAQTQQTQTFFYLLFLYVAFVYRKTNSLWKNAAFALTFSMAYLARQTSAILLLAYWMFEFYVLVISPKRNIKRFFQIVIFQGTSLAVVNSIIFYGLYTVMGLYKALDVYGMGVVAVSADTSIRKANFILEFFSQNVAIISQIVRFPLLMVLLVYFLATVFPLKKFTYWFYYSTLILLTGWILKFIGALDSKIFLIFTFTEGILLYLFIMWHQNTFKHMGTKQKQNDTLLFFFFWFAIYFVIYSTWIKFRIPYLVEIFPLLVMMGGAMIRHLIVHHRMVGAYAVMGLCMVLMFYQVRSYTTIYSGSFSPQTVNEVADIIRSKTSPEDYVMTASPIFPFVAERKLPLNISHPSWYGIPNFDEDLLQLYLPPFETLERYVLTQKPKIIIVDQVGMNDYFKRSKAMQRMIQTEYKLIKRINDRTIEIEIYEIK